MAILKRILSIIHLKTGTFVMLEIEALKSAGSLYELVSSSLKSRSTNVIKSNQLRAAAQEADFFARREDGLYVQRW